MEGAYCQCSAGFANLDALDNTGCVPKGVLVAGYMLITVVGTVAFLFLTWHALRHRHLPLSVRISHRASLRQRLTLSAALYTAGCAGVFGTAASFGGNRSPWGNGICEMFYSVFYPFRVFAVAMVAALWVNAIPTRALPKTSYATRHKQYSEANHLYERLGLFGMAVTSAAGVLSSAWPAQGIMVADMVSCFCEAAVSICIINVARQTILAIDSRGAQHSSPISMSFYSAARQAIMGKVLALLSVSLIYFVAACTLHFTYFGHHTPILFLVLKFLDGILWLCVVVHFARPGANARPLRGSLIPQFLFTPTSSENTSRPLSYVSGGFRNIKSKVTRVLPAGGVVVVQVYVAADSAELPCSDPI